MMLTPRRVALAHGPRWTGDLTKDVQSEQARTASEVEAKAGTKSASLSGSE